MSKQDFIELLLNCNGFSCIAEGSACEVSCSVRRAVRNKDDESILDASEPERVYDGNMFRLHTNGIESVIKVAPYEYDMVADGAKFHFIVPQ